MPNVEVTAEVATEMHRLHGRIAELERQVQEALGMPEASWPDMVAEAKALSQFKAVHQSNTAAKLDKIKAALMGYDAAKLGGDAYSVVERFI